MKHSISEQQVAFAVLQPACTALLPLRRDPKALAAGLERLKSILNSSTFASSPDTLEAGNRDYVLLPLLLIVDSIAFCRARDKAGSDERKQSIYKAPFGAVASDAAAEAGLSALIALLNVSVQPSGQVLLNLLDRLVRVIALPRTESCEEVRLGAMLALQAALGARQQAALRCDEALADTCNATLLGNSISLLLQVDKGEMSIGACGSGRIRTEALRCLRLLVQAVGDGTALAFFVPGLVSGLGATLAAAGNSRGATVRSGPSASSAAAVEAMQALVIVLCLTLSDSYVNSVLGPEPRDTGRIEDPFAELQQLASPTAPPSSSADDLLLNGSPSTNVLVKPHSGSPPDRGLVANRDDKWIRNTSSRVSTVLQAVLGPLSDHPRSTVRAATAIGAAKLLNECGTAMQPAKPLLVGILLAAAQDDWIAVSQPAREWLSIAARNRDAPNPGCPQPLSWPIIETAIMSLVEGLPAAARSSDAALAMHARRITTALQAAPPGWVATHVLNHPIRRKTLVAAFAAVFEFERTSSMLQLHTNTVGSSVAVVQRDTHDAAAVGEARGSDPESLQPTKGSPAVVTEAAVLLPRMLQGLLLIRSIPTYTAVANALRMASRVAASRPEGARCLIEEALLLLQKASISCNATSGGWQEECAAAAVVASELLYGSVPAWDASSCMLAPRPPQTQQPQDAARSQTSEARLINDYSDELRVKESTVSHNGPGNHNGPGSPTSSAAAASSGGSGSLPEDILDAAEAMLEAFTNGSLLALCTQPLALCDGAQRISPQVASENAMLVQVLLNGIGTVARCIGQCLGTPGTLLRLVLLPTVERLGDPSPLIAEAASSAISAICTACGYSGLGALVADNIDYTIDGICARLRHLGDNPRAPHLLAALLGSGTIAPQLLPLLAEPAARALRGLSITARRAQPSTAVPFLEALQVMCSGARAEADAVLKEIRAFAASVASQLAAGQAAAATAAASRRCRTALVEEVCDDDVSSTDRAGKQGPPGDDATIEEISEYFLHHEQNMDRQLEAAGADTKVDLTHDERRKLETLARRDRAAAKISGAVADVASPLLLSSDLKMALLATDSALGALTALRATSASADLEAEIVEATTRSDTQPLPPDPPRLLPAVHVLWQPLIAALQDKRAPVAERAAAAVAEATIAGGAQFMSHRWRKQAWLALAIMLAGPSVQAPRPEVGPDERATAPAAAVRACLAALRSLEKTATSAASAVLQVVAADVVEAILVSCLLPEAQPPAIHLAAAKTLRSVALVDSDAVWIALATVDSKPAQLCLQPPSGVFQPIEQVMPIRQRKQPISAAAQQRVSSVVTGLDDISIEWHLRCPISQ